jgi:hypothetical protein
MKITGDKWRYCPADEPGSEPFWTLEVMTGVKVFLYLVKGEPWMEIGSGVGDGAGTTRLFSSGLLMFREAEHRAAQFFEKLGDALRHAERPVERLLEQIK